MSCLLMQDFNANNRFRFKGSTTASESPVATASPGLYMRLRLGSTVRVKPKSELEMGMLLDEPSPPVNFAASRTWILVRNSAPAYRWIWFHPTRLCEVGARSGRLHQPASRDGTALILFVGLADDHC